MKKFKYVMMLTVMMFLLTGCVKFNANIEISKNKNMNMEVIYAIDSSLMSYMGGDGELLSDDDKKELEQEGFTVENYSEDSFTGYKLVKKVKNIDDISTTDDINYNISGLLDDYEANNKNMFKVKKGLFKNTYYANIKFDASDSDLNNDFIDDDTDSTDDIDTYTAYDLNGNNSSSGFDFPGMDFSNFTKNMDLKFNVTLPYKAVSNNANNVSEKDKSLSWDLSATKASNIEFSFYLYNLPLIYTLVGVIVVTILLVVGLAVGLNKKKNTVKPVANAVTEG